MKRVAISATLTVLILMSGSVFGTDILAPGDFIIAIDADGGSRSPGAETVDHAIDGVIQKYLNFGDGAGGDEQNTGFIVTPAFGSSVMDSFQITTANDAEPRDPASWALYGTNEQIVSADHSDGTAESWTPIDSGSISLPAGRNTPGPVVAVNNSTSYRSYKMIFPTVKDAAAANSMQIAEIQFFGVGKNARRPEPDNGIAVGPIDDGSNVYLLLDYVPGDGAIEHRGYFADNYDDVANRQSTAYLGTPTPWPTPKTKFIVGWDDDAVIPNEFARLPLVRGKTYYWCVDEWDGSQFWEGELWSFTVMPEEAWDPTPADGAPFVAAEPDLTLSWKIGDLVVQNYDVSYLVYWGTDEAAVEAATTGGILVTDEATSTVVTGLPSGTEVFWRVDTKRDSSGPPWDSFTTKGVVWSFTTLPVATITDPDLVGWWKLDGEYGDIVFDDSGYGNHGTAFGNTQWMEGAPGFGNAILLDGTIGKYVQVPNSSSLNMTAAITVAAWVKPNTWSGGNRRILQKGDTDNQYRLWYENGENELRFDCRDVGTVQTDTPPPPTGEWHHVAATYDGVTMRIYTDGRIVNEVPFTGTIGISTSPLNIGTKTPTSVATDHFDGLLDEVRLYNVALTPREMKLLAGLLKATNPDPSDYATDVARTPTLSWEPGAFVAAVNGHKLYFGDDEDEVLNRTAGPIPLTNPSYPVPFELDLGGTYYWIVDEVNEPNTWEGDLWSRTTTSSRSGWTAWATAKAAATIQAPTSSRVPATV